MANLCRKVIEVNDDCNERNFNDGPAKKMLKQQPKKQKYDTSVWRGVKRNSTYIDDCEDDDDDDDERISLPSSQDSILVVDEGLK